MWHIGDKIAFCKNSTEVAMSKKMGVLVASLIYVLIACGMLTACGTKGPLYIPEQRYPQADSNKPNNAPMAENKLEKSSNYTQPTSQ